MTADSMSLVEMGVATVGLVLISIFTRSVFFLSQKPWSLPDRIEKALRYAPLAALAAVVAPDVLLTQGQWTGEWSDARYPAAAFAIAWAAWHREMLGTIVVGMVVFTALRLGMGW